jgi:hypothetical protein
MAITLIPRTILTVGQETDPVTILESAEVVTLELAVTQLGLGDSQVRLVCIDNLGRVRLTLLMDGTGTRQASLERIDTFLVCRVECLQGSAQVSVQQLLGAEKFGEGSGSINPADIPDGSLTDAMFSDNTINGERFTDNTIEGWKLAKSAHGCGVEFGGSTDPGDGNTIQTPDTGGCFWMLLTTGAVGETRVLQRPTNRMQMCLLYMNSHGGGDLVITNSAGWQGGGIANDTMTFTAPHDFAILFGVGTNSTGWRVIYSEGVTFS